MHKKADLTAPEFFFWLAFAIIIGILIKYHNQLTDFRNFVSNLNLMLWAIAFIIVIVIYLVLHLITHISIKSGKFVYKRINEKQKNKQDRANFIQIETNEAENLLLHELPIDENNLTNETEKLRDKVNLYMSYKELEHFSPRFKERLAKATATLNKVRKKRIIKETNEEKWKSQRLEEKEIALEQKQENEDSEDENIQVTNSYKNTKTIEGQKAYIADELDLGDKSFLLSSGFIWHRQTNIDGKEKRYLVFDDKYESPNHIICVKEIVDFIKKFTDDIKTYRTVMPDIVFSCNGKEFAIEVETGTIIRDMKKMQNKIDLLNKNYKNNWFFFVTNRNMEKEYSKLGKVATKRNIKLKIRQIFHNSEK